MNISIENIEEKNSPLQYAIVDFIFNECIQVNGKRAWHNYKFEFWMNGDCFLHIHWHDLKNPDKEHKHKINYNVFVNQRQKELSDIIAKFVNIESNKNEG